MSELQSQWRNRGQIGIIEKKMETTLMGGLYYRGYITQMIYESEIFLRSIRSIPRLEQVQGCWFCDPRA